MFNPSKLAQEIFSVLRSFDYTVSIFDFNGNRVYEPDDARRFFASPKNITVSINEDSENSIVKLFLSQATDVDEVKGLIETMRTTASRYGVLFNVRKYQKELSPRDLSPNSGIENETGIPLKNKANSDVTTHMDALVQDIKQLRDELPDVLDHLKKRGTKMNESMINIPALGTDVEVNAWDDFKKGRIELIGDPVDIERSGDLNAYRVGALRNIVDKMAHDGLANALEKVADAIEAGSRDTILTNIADRATDIVYITKEPEADTVEEDNIKTIKLSLGLEVEKAAWDNFKNGELSLKGEVKAGKTIPQTLHNIAKQTSDKLLAKMFDAVANRLMNDPKDDVLKGIADRAIKAADVKDIVVTESIKEFNTWFEAYSIENIFESEIDATIEDYLSRGDIDSALSIAYDYVVDNFDIEDFYSRQGGDFDYEGDAREVEASVVRQSLQDYLTNDIEQMVPAANVPERDVKEMVDEIFPDVQDDMANDGWVFDSLDEALETHDILLPSDEKADFKQEVETPKGKNDPEVQRLIKLATNR